MKAKALSRRPSLVRKLAGGCACGSIRYQLLARPMFVNCCHCDDCQRLTGSAFVLNAIIRDPGDQAPPWRAGGRAGAGSKPRSGAITGIGPIYVSCASAGSWTRAR